MTIIVGLRDPNTGEVWVGADSRGMIEDFIWPAARQKIHRCGGWVIAVAGSSNNARIVREKETAISACRDVSEISNLLIAEFKARDYAQKTDHTGPVNYGQEFVVANHAGVHGIMVDGTVAPADFVAMGSGADYAYGAWRALSLFRGDMNGRSIVTAAIDAAIMFDAGCGGEVVVEKVR